MNCNMRELKRGTQIVYVPSHVNGDVRHRDFEEGFVADNGLLNSISVPRYVHCYYWCRTDPFWLRTMANSQATPLECIVIKNTREQYKVEKALKYMKYGIPTYISPEQHEKYVNAIFRKEE